MSMNADNYKLSFFSFGQDWTPALTLYGVYIIVDLIVL